VEKKESWGSSAPEKKRGAKVRQQLGPWGGGRHRCNLPERGGELKKGRRRVSDVGEGGTGKDVGQTTFLGREEKGLE